MHSGRPWPSEAAGSSVHEGKRDRPSMISMPLDDFTKGKVTGDGYLKPSKRNLADLIVTEATLPRAATVLLKLATSARSIREMAADQI